MQKKIVTQMSFHFVGTQALTAGAAAFALNPTNLSPRAATEADGFTYWRMRSLRFRYINNSAPTGPSALGVIGGAPNTLPANLGQVGELLDSCCRPTVTAAGSVILARWSEWVHVRKELVQGPLPWYNTFPGTFAAEFDAPCTMCFAGSGTDSFLYELRFVLEFKDPANTGNTPAAVTLRQKLREDKKRLVAEAERKALIKILSPVEMTSSPLTEKSSSGHP